MSFKHLQNNQNYKFTISNGDKHMKKILYCALSIAAAAHPAMAQTVVYGIVDTGVEYVTNINAAGNSVVKMPSLTGSVPSRIGFKGTEDLGGGLTAFFVLESGFGMDTGALGLGGRLFGRQANVGVKSAYGALTLGRQMNMTLYSYMKADVMGPNIHGLSGMDGYLPNARSDNAIGYLGKFSELSIGATYSAGRDAAAAGGPAATNCPGEIAGNARACRQVTALLAYDVQSLGSESFGVATAYDKLHGGPGAAGGLTRSDYHVERMSLSAYALLGKTRIGGGLIRRKTHAASDNTADLAYLGVSAPFAPNWVFDSQISRLDIKQSPDASTLLAARATCQLSRRTALYVSVAHIRNQGAAAIAASAGSSVGVGMRQSGVMTGMRHTF
jgi:predicted porin